MSGNSKEISNPYSTGGGGVHFENRVQTAFTILLLSEGLLPCPPFWPIVKIKLQGRYKGFETDDLIIHCEEPNSGRKSKLLGQIKHSITFTNSDKKFSEVIQAMWNDFNNTKVFSEDSKDVIALICSPLSATDTDSVRPLFEQARNSENTVDFINRIELGKFTSDDQRKKLEVFKTQLKKANNDNELTNEQLWRFLKSIHLLIYDLDIKGVTLSLLYSLIEQYSKNNSTSIWTQVYEHVQWVSEGAGSITVDSIPTEISNEFKKVEKQVIPKEFVKDTSKIVITDWNDHDSAKELAIACIVGSWNENMASDKSILSKFARLEYEKWILKLRDVLQYPEGPIELNNGILRVKDRQKLWQTLGTRIFDDHLNTLRECAVLVLTERDPKFELPKKDQFAAKVYGKVLTYSNQIRKGLAESLALTSCLSNALINCSLDKPDITAVLTVREIFKQSDWVLWASLNDLLPIFAEAAPDEFIKIVEDKLNIEPTLFNNLFAQEGGGVTGWNYMTGLLWSLETLAWEETYLVNVTILLGELANRDPGGNWANRPSNSLTTIFLPWLPQTFASIEKRKIAVKTLNKELPEVSWKLLLSLLPNAHQVSSHTRKPSYRNSIPADRNEKVTTIDYWKQVDFYAELVVENAKDNVEKLEKLIDNLDNLPRPVFENLLSHLSSKKITTQPEEIKVNLWNALVDFTTKHKRYSDAKWALPADIIVKIDKVSNKLAPKDPLYFYARLFGKRDMDLFEEKGNWEEQHKKLDESRQQAIKEILDKSGIDEIFKFLNNVESSTNVGNALGAISNDSIDEKLLPFYLDTEDKKIEQFINAYVWRKYFVSGWGWIDKMISVAWTKAQIAHFLTFLPFIFETWERVSDRLSDSESLYWEKTNVNPYQTDSYLTFAIDKLIKYGRPHGALDCLQKELYDKKPLDIRRAINALKAALHSHEQPYSMDTYNITEIIKALQNNSLVSEDDLFSIEWAYLSLLDEHTGVTPKTLELRLASDSDFYCEVIRTVYRSKKVSKEEQKEPLDNEKAIATNAWDLLYKWKTAPGTQKDGSFDEGQFKKWLKIVKGKCNESGHLEVALQHAGKALYYSPKDVTGFWINEAVVDELNKKDADELRTGFSTEVFNSRGFHMVDPTGKPEFEYSAIYRKKAEDIENAGYQRFAITLRKLAESYEAEAKRIIEENKQELND